MGQSDFSELFLISDLRDARVGMDNVAPFGAVNVESLGRVLSHHKTKIVSAQVLGGHQGTGLHARSVAVRSDVGTV